MKSITTYFLMFNGASCHSEYRPIASTLGRPGDDELAISGMEATPEQGRYYPYMLARTEKIYEKHPSK
jgi:hypothetical protein